MSSLTAGKAWVRWGVMFAIDTGGTAPGHADVTLSLTTLCKAEVAGSTKGRLTSSVTSDAFEAVTGYIPALWAQKVMAAFIVASGNANFRCRLVYRLAGHSQSAPGAWTDTTDTNTSGNTERSTGDLSLTLGNYQWVQFGIAYSSSSGTSYAEVMVSVSVRRT